MELGKSYKECKLHNFHKATEVIAPENSILPQGEEKNVQGVILVCKDKTSKNVHPLQTPCPDTKQ